MSLKFATTILLLALCTLSSADILFHTRSVLNKRVSDIFINSRALIENNPTDFIVCFGEYDDEVTALTADYQVQYEKCANDAINAQDIIDTDMQPERNRLTTDAGSTCASFDACNLNSENAQTFFGCYSAASTAATTSTYNIGASANNATKEVNFRLSNVDYAKSSCNDTAKAQFVKASNNAYNGFNDCLLGKPKPTTTPSPPPTDAPATTEEPEVPATTEEPEVPVTTEEPEVPATTEEPEVPEVPVTTEEPEAPATTEEPEVPEVPVTTEEPEAPATTEEPEVPEVPVTTEEPEVPEVPVTTEEPEAPATTEEPEVPEVPVTTEEPEAPATTQEPSPEEDLDMFKDSKLNFHALRNRALRQKH